MQALHDEEGERATCGDELMGRLMTLEVQREPKEEIKMEKKSLRFLEELGGLSHALASENDINP